MPRAFSTTPPSPSPAGDWKASIIKSRPSPRSPTASAMNSFSFFVYYPFTTLGSNLSDEPNFVDASTPDNSVQRGSANHVQVFNNRTLAGDFLPVSIISSTVHQGELTTDAELMYAT